MTAVDPAPERAAYLAAGVDPTFVTRALSVPADDIWIPDAALLRTAGVVTEVFAGYGGKGSVADLAAMLRSQQHGDRPVGASLKEQLALYGDELNGSGDNLVEQARPLLQVEDIHIATGGGMGLLDARDSGFFTVAMPEFWQRPEMEGLLHDVRMKPDKHG